MRTDLIIPTLLAADRLCILDSMKEVNLSLLNQVLSSAKDKLNERQHKIEVMEVVSNSSKSWPEFSESRDFEEFLDETDEFILEDCDETNKQIFLYFYNRYIKSLHGAMYEGITNDMWNDLKQRLPSLEGEVQTLLNMYEIMNDEISVLEGMIEMINNDVPRKDYIDALVQMGIQIPELTE